LDETVPIADEVVERPLAAPAWLRRPAIINTVCWLLCGIMWTQQSFLVLLMRNELAGATWFSLARSDMISALVWALLTPAILRLSTRFPLRRRQLLARSL